MLAARLITLPNDPAPRSQSLPSSRLHMEISPGSMSRTSMDPSARFSASPAGAATAPSGLHQEQVDCDQSSGSQPPFAPQWVWRHHVVLATLVAPGLSFRLAVHCVRS